MNNKEIKLLIKSGRKIVSTHAYIEVVLGYIQRWIAREKALVAGAPDCT